MNCELLEPRRLLSMTAVVAPGPGPGAIAATPVPATVELGTAVAGHTLNGGPSTGALGTAPGASGGAFSLSIANAAAPIALEAFSMSFGAGTFSMFLEFGTVATAGAGAGAGAASSFGALAPSDALAMGGGGPSSSFSPGLAPIGVDGGTSTGAGGAGDVGAASNPNVSVVVVPVNLGLSSGFSTSMGASGAGLAGPGFSTAETFAPIAAYIVSGPSHQNHVVIVVALYQPWIVHLGASTEPATFQAVLATAAREQLTIVAPHTGQGPLPGGAALMLWGGADAAWGWGPSTFDFVEPYAPEALDALPAAGLVPIAPAPAPPLAPAPAPALDRAAPAGAAAVVPLGIDPLDRRSAPRTTADAWAGEILGREVLDEASGAPSASLFGVAAVAVAGYQLALRENRRFSGRWLPGRSRTRSISRRATWTAGPGPRPMEFHVKATP